MGSKILLWVEGKTYKIMKEDGKGQLHPAANFVRDFPNEAKWFASRKKLRAWDSQGRELCAEEVVVLIEKSQTL